MLFGLLTRVGPTKEPCVGWGSRVGRIHLHTFGKNSAYSVRVMELVSFLLHCSTSNLVLEILKHEYMRHSGGQFALASSHSKRHISVPATNSGGRVQPSAVICAHDRRRNVVRRGADLRRCQSVVSSFRAFIRRKSLAHSAAEEGVPALRCTQLSAGDTRSARQRSNVDGCRHQSVLSLVVVVARRRCGRPSPDVVASLHDHRIRPVDHMLPGVRGRCHGVEFCPISDPPLAGSCG